MPSGLQTSPQGRKLWKWLTGPEGFAMYSGSPHPWTTLRDFLIAHGVPPGQADGEATNVMLATPAGPVPAASRQTSGRAQRWGADRGALQGRQVKPPKRYGRHSSR